jgi:tetratricopeptide (TPR) repeat protein
LGELADRRGDFATAIEELEQARASGVLSPLTHADLYATLARAYSASGQPRRAVELLEDCLSQTQAQAQEDVSAEVRFATYLSYALSDLGELERARVVVRQALGRAQKTPDPYSRVRLYWSLARLSLMEGKPRSALRQIQRAIGLLEATEDTRQLRARTPFVRRDLDRRWRSRAGRKRISSWLKSCWATMPMRPIWRGSIRSRQERRCCSAKTTPPSGSRARRSRCSPEATR